MKIVVIGGGAAGFFAAIHASRKGNEVILLEKSSKLLAKVKVSGGGRCNVTNSCTDNSILVSNYPRGGKELRGPFSKFSTQQTIDWFEERGVELKHENDGRVFPVTDNSQTIIDCLVETAMGLGVQIEINTPVRSFQVAEPGFVVRTALSDIHADKVIVATGGGPAIKNYQWLQQLGIAIIPPGPSLFTFNVPVSPFADLPGVAVADAHVKVAGSSFNERGPLLFTHWGISGPAVLRLSAWAAQWLHEKNYHFDVIINFCPGLNQEAIRGILKEHMAQSGNRFVQLSPPVELPKRLWAALCNVSGISETLKWNETPKAALSKLVSSINGFMLNVSGKTTFKEEFVTCGGVDLKEINMQTMSCKKIPDLYFAGEVLNIDGITGGYNFQAAWTTGYIAGISASGK